MTPVSMLKKNERIEVNQTDRLDIQRSGDANDLATDLIISEKL